METIPAGAVNHDNPMILLSKAELKVDSTKCVNLISSPILLMRCRPSWIG